MKFNKKELPKGMVEFVHDEGIVRFTIPERPTVRQQLEYLGGASIYNEGDRFVRWWEAAKSMIDEWECKLMPKLKEVDLDKLNDPNATAVITWVSTRVRLHMNKLDSIPKN